MPDPIDFRAVVKEAMARRGYHPKRLSDESGVGYASVHRFVNGAGGLTADNLGAVLTALGVSVKLPRATA